MSIIPLVFSPFFSKLFTEKQRKAEKTITSAKRMLHTFFISKLPFFAIKYSIRQFFCASDEQKRGCRTKATQKEEKTTGQPEKGLPGCRFHNII